MIKFYALIKSRVLNRRTFTFFGLLLCSATAFTQNVGINGTGTAPHPSAGLDVSFTDKGLLIPRVKLKSSADVTTIPSPEISLLVYNTEEISDVTPGYYFYDGRAWQKLSTTSTTGLTSSSWGLSGNSVSSDNHFLGTTNNDALKFRTNNLHRMIIDSDGSVGIGSNPVFADDKEKVLIDLGGSQIAPLPLTSYTGLNITGYITKYLQLNIQNKYSGPEASTDMVVTANNGTETSNFVDLGINNTGNTKNYFGVANDSYLYNMGQDFLIGTGTSNKSLIFLTGGGVKVASPGNPSTERMRINGVGNVGIGNNNPQFKLHISASSNPLFISGLSTATSADTVLIIDKGAIKKAVQATVNNQSWAFSGNSLTAEQKIGTTSTHALPFITANTEKMRIATNGFVGIGQINPTNKLHISSTSNPLFMSGVQTLSNADTVLTIDKGVVKRTLKSSITNQSWSIAGNTFESEQKIGTISETPFPIVTGNVERMRISSDGFIGIGNSNPQYKLHISSDFNPLFISGVELGSPDTVLTISGGVVKKALRSVVNDQSWSIYGNSLETEQKFGTKTSIPLSFITDDIERVRISKGGTMGIATTPELIDLDTTSYKLVVNGDAVATSWATTSDFRLKRNIQPLTYGLSSITRLQPVTYNWIDPKQSSEKQIGLIAQDVRKVIPEIVQGDETKEKLSINYTELIPVLINAIKEQQQKIDSQQKQIDELKELIKQK